MRRLGAACLAAAALLAGGCGESEDGSAGTAPRAAAGAFPVTFEHKYGTTTLESEPERIVVVGLREQDALLALGVVPVATTEWVPAPNGIHPWARDELGDAPPPKLLKGTDGVPIEEVAALRPDVIVAAYSGTTRKEYATLSKLAPVVAQPKGKPDFGTSWQEETLIAGKVVGKVEAAQRLVDRTEQLIADTAAEHPEFAGKEAAMAMDYQGAFVYGEADARSRTLAALGFAYPKALRGVFPEFGGQLSDERLDALDVDALVWFADPKGVARLKRDPVYAKLFQEIQKEAKRTAAAAAAPDFAQPGKADL